MINEIFNKLNELVPSFLANAKKDAEGSHGSRTAGARARKEAIQLKKLLTEYRKVSNSVRKYRKAEREAQKNS